MLLSWLRFVHSSKCRILRRQRTCLMLHCLKGNVYKRGWVVATESTSKRIMVSVVSGVILAAVLAFLGLGGGGQSGGASTGGSGSQDQGWDPPTTQIVDDPVAGVNICYTDGGTCQVAVPSGSYCECLDLSGYVWPGLAE